MRQFYAECLEQLDLALDQLALNDENYTRFAIMLIDNVAELILHDVAQSKLLVFERYGDAPRSEDISLCRKAVGRNFDSKVKFANKIGLFDDATKNSILLLHEYRNTSYHRGERHERFLRALTILYLQLVCRIFCDWEPLTWGFASNEVIPLRVRKYVRNSESILEDGRQRYVNAFDRLGKIASNLRYDLISDLSTEMGLVIEDIDQAIDFLARDAPRPSTRNEVIIRCQTSALVFSEEHRARAINAGCSGNSIAELENWFEEEGLPFKKDPIPSWRRRLASLENEKEPHAALKKFGDFEKQTRDFRDQILESAFQLDMYNQSEIDRMRGK